MEKERETEKEKLENYIFNLFFLRRRNKKNQVRVAITKSIVWNIHGRRVTLWDQLLPYSPVTSPSWKDSRNLPFRVILNKCLIRLVCRIE